MCRNIKVLHNFEPPATHEEIEASALQYVRKISGCRSPSKANETAFLTAVKAITRCTIDLLDQLETDAPKKKREKIAKRRLLQ